MKIDELLADVQKQAQERNYEVIIRLLNTCDNLCDFAKAKIRAMWLQEQYHASTASCEQPYIRNSYNWEYEKLINNITFYLIPCDSCEGCNAVKDGNWENISVIQTIINKAVSGTIKRSIPNYREINQYEVAKGGPEAVCVDKKYGWAQPWDGSMGDY